MKKVEINCDYCNEDLTMSSNCMDWRVSLKSEPIPSKGGIVTLMNIPPAFEKELHFCGKGCLFDYLDKLREQ